MSDWCNITFSSSDANPMYYAQRFYMLDEDNEYYESYEEAEHYAEIHMSDYEIEIEGLDNFYSLEPIEVVSIRVEEFELEDIEE